MVAFGLTDNPMSSIHRPATTRAWATAADRCASSSASDYDHTNGSHQVKIYHRMIVGDDLPYTTPAMTTYDQLADETLTVTVVGEDRTTIKEETFTVSEIEEMIYGERCAHPATADRARGKGYYFTHFAGELAARPIRSLRRDRSELLHSLKRIGLPRYVGTVTQYHL